MGRIISSSRATSKPCRGLSVRLRPPQAGVSWGEGLDLSLIVGGGPGRAAEGIIARRSCSKPCELCLPVNKSFIMPLTSSSCVPGPLGPVQRAEGRAVSAEGLTSPGRGLLESLKQAVLPASPSWPTGPECSPEPPGALITAENCWLNRSSQVLGHLRLTALRFLSKVLLGNCVVGGGGSAALRTS